MIKKCFETHLSLFHFVQQFWGWGGVGGWEWGFQYIFPKQAGEGDIELW